MLYRSLDQLFIIPSLPSRPMNIQIKIVKADIPEEYQEKIIHRTNEALDKYQIEKVNLKNKYAVLLSRANISSNFLSPFLRIWPLMLRRSATKSLVEHGTAALEGTSAVQ
jgi:hypothetical protein